MSRTKPVGPVRLYRSERADPMFIQYVCRSRKRSHSSVVLWSLIKSQSNKLLATELPQHSLLPTGKNTASENRCRPQRSERDPNAFCDKVSLRASIRKRRTQSSKQTIHWRVRVLAASWYSRRPAQLHERRSLPFVVVLVGLQQHSEEYTHK